MSLDLHLFVQGVSLFRAQAWPACPHRNPLERSGQLLRGAVLGLALIATLAPMAQAVTLELRPTASSDDAEESATGSMYINSSDLELTQDATTQVVGIRWPGVTIPAGATITAAWVQFVAKEAHSEVTNLTLRANLTGNAAAFVIGAGNISLRALTTASVAWAPAAWTAGAAGAAQRTPSLNSVIQQVVSGAGWASGNALALVITGTGHRTTWAWDGKAASSPLLHVEYTTGAPPPDNPPVASVSAVQIASPPRTVTANGGGSTDTDLTPIASYSFNFGDGTAAVVTSAPTATATHTYAADGTYTITLIVTDTALLTSAPVTTTVSVTTVENPPVANLTASQVASPPLTVTASGALSTDTDLTPIASYSFNFGDGTALVVTSAPTATATHTYALAGTYTVTLIVTDTALLTSAPATATVVVGTGAVATLEKRPAATADDAEESATGSVSLSSGDLELTQDSSNQTVGMRWTGITIPPGSTITAAWIQFGARQSHSEATSLTFRGEAANNAAIFTTVTRNVSLRTRTTASTGWVPPAWTAGQAGASQRTPDLSAVIQEIVSRPGWANGNALAMIVTGTGRRSAWSRDGNLSLSPLLHIEYLTGPVPENPPVASLSVVQVGSPPLSVTASGAASTDIDATPIASYQFTFGDGTPAVVTTAPTATANHTYAAAGTYTVTLLVTDTGGFTSALATANITVSLVTGPPIAVHVGYYDTHHPDNPRPKPDPWMGSPGIVFVGTPDNSNGDWDSSGLRLDNLSAGALSVVVTVDIGPNHYALWGSRSIPAGGTLVLAQTAFENFDGSDTNPAGCYGCDPKLCLTQVQSTVPVVHVTISGTTTNYYDTGQILNTYGVDAAGCPPTSGRNDESSPWTRIYTSPSGAAPAASNALEEAPTTDRAGTSWLAAPFPNPVRDQLALRFATAERGRVHLAIYDVAGRLVQTALDLELEAGEYRKVLLLGGVDAGVYYCRLQTPQGTLNQSFVIMP